MRVYCRYTLILRHVYNVEEVKKEKKNTRDEVPGVTAHNTYNLLLVLYYSIGICRFNPGTGRIITMEDISIVTLVQEI